MESDVGDELTHTHDTDIDSGDVGGTGGPSQGVQGGILGPLGVQSSSVQSLEITQPLAAKLNKLTCDNEEPKPGPSNSAADFDLEVFDSGSSCSNEECWEVDEKGGKIKVHQEKNVKVSESTNLENTVQNPPISVKQLCESECESVSEAEEMEMDQGSLHEEDRVSNSEENVKDGDCTTANVETGDSFLPEETIDRKESVELWKSRNETDVIVSDHDVFGTDENDEDSLDSLVLRVNSDSYSRRGSLAFSDNSGSSATCAIPRVEDHDDSTMSSETVLANMEHSKVMAPLHFLEEEQDGSIRPKRKSGSLSELVLAGSLPLKKQRPESLPTASGTTCNIPMLMETPDSGSMDHVSDNIMFCDTDTAPTSPVGLSMPSPSVSPPPIMALNRPGPSIQGRNLIPDKENPPQEILNWVATFSRWSHAERLLAIDQLIDTCEPQQVRHMMQVIEPQFQRDFISLLPKELALYVLTYLEPRDLLRAAQTCRYWRVLAEDNLLWREKCKEAGLKDCRENFRRRSKITTGFIYSPWKSGFMRQHNIEMNWRINPVRTPKVLKGHDDHVITCLQFCGNRIVSGSDDNTLKVWSAMTGKCLRTLVGHTGGVWSSQMANNVIVSGSTDRTLKVWNAESGTCVHTLYGHTSTVRCMHLHGTKVVSGSRDATLRMWDVETGECLHVLVGHVAAVRCVQYDGRLVVSGAYDYMVKVWNPEREECLHTLSGHTNRVYSLQFDGIHVVSGSLDTSIRVWDVETGACKHALMGHQSLTSGMELKDNILVSGNADSTVKIWDILTGQCLQTLSGPNKHQSAVTCLQFNSKFVVTSSDDGTVKLWDVKTGEFIRDLVALESGGSGGVVWRIRSSPTKLVCAVGSRNGTEETKLMVLDFDAEVK
eukprot:GFUD01106364.1.p1 GENE.GFUD01106364.1~~GFUD01106364.1.p1  ORF type:complete len:885 (-),score=204.08 GFUD01106364.1:568-3222(-)